MEQTAIQKINKLGRAGHIICKIAKIFLIIAAVCVVLAGIVTFLLPSDFLQIRVEGKADIALNFDGMGINLEDMTGTDLNEFIDEQDIQQNWEINNVDYAVDNVTVDGNNISVSAQAETHSISWKSLRLCLIVALLGLILYYIGTQFLSDLCKAISLCQTPFEEGVIQKMWRFAVALIPISLIGGNLDGIVQIIMTGNGTIGFAMNLEMIVAILLLFAMVYIFKYGAQLQQESDETL